MANGVEQFLVRREINVVLLERLAMARGAAA
jgi:hypothetical protein